jgi:hypothetical protein
MKTLLKAVLLSMTFGMFLISTDTADAQTWRQSRREYRRELKRERKELRRDMRQARREYIRNVRRNRNGWYYYSNGRMYTYPSTTYIYRNGRFYRRY